MAISSTQYLLLQKLPNSKLYDHNVIQAAMVWLFLSHKMLLVPMLEHIFSSTTRIYSSRMRTVCCSDRLMRGVCLGGLCLGSVCLGDVCPGGFCLGGGICLGGVRLGGVFPGWVSAQSGVSACLLGGCTPPPQDRILDTHL